LFVEKLTSQHEWTDFLKSAPKSTFYHSLEWKNVLEKSFGYKTFYFLIKKDTGETVGIFPAILERFVGINVLNSLPHSDFGGPLIQENYTIEASPCLRKSLERFCFEEKISFTRQCYLNGESMQFFNSAQSFSDNHRGIMNLNFATTNPDFIWEKMLGRSQRKKIRRFERDGFQLREACAKSDLEEFLGTYYGNMKHIGANVLPVNFFNNLWDYLYPEYFRILIVEKNSAIGGIAFFKYDRSIYLTYLGIDRASLASRYNLAFYLYWNAIKWAYLHKLKFVSFGSTPARPKSPHEITNYVQKKTFGASLIPQQIVYTPFDLKGSLYLTLASKAISTWTAMRNHMPSKAQRLIEKRMRGIF
jgi:hypothetical protein